MTAQSPSVRPAFASAATNILPVCNLQALSWACFHDATTSDASSPELSCPSPAFLELHASFLARGFPTTWIPATGSGFFLWVFGINQSEDFPPQCSLKREHVGTSWVPQAHGNMHIGSHCLLFSALCDLMEADLAAVNYVRVGRIFVQVQEHGRLSPSCLMLSHRILDKSTVYLQVAVKRHHLRMLSPEDLARDKQITGFLGPHGISISIARRGLHGHNSSQEQAQPAQPWAPKTKLLRPGVPRTVNVELGSKTIQYPSHLVFVQDLSIGPAAVGDSTQHLRDVQNSLFRRTCHNPTTNADPVLFAVELAQRSRALRNQRAAAARNADAAAAAASAAAAAAPSAASTPGSQPAASESHQARKRARIESASSANAATTSFDQYASQRTGSSDSRLPRVGGGSQNLLTPPTEMDDSDETRVMSKPYKPEASIQRLRQDDIIMYSMPSPSSPPYATMHSDSARDPPYVVPASYKPLPYTLEVIPLRLNYCSSRLHDISGYEDVTRVRDGYVLGHALAGSEMTSPCAPFVPNSVAEEQVPEPLAPVDPGPPVSELSANTLNILLKREAVRRREPWPELAPALHHAPDDFALEIELAQQHIRASPFLEPPPSTRKAFIYSMGRTARLTTHAHRLLCAFDGSMDDFDQSPPVVPAENLLKTSSLDERTVHSVFCDVVKMLQHRHAGAQPLTFSQLARGFLDTLSIPSISVGHDDAMMSLSPQAIPLWQYLTLEPFSPKKNIAYLAVVPDVKCIVDRTAMFLSDVGAQYELCRLGQHCPAALGDLDTDGLFPTQLDLSSLEAWTNSARLVCQDVAKRLVDFVHNPRGAPKHVDLGRFRKPTDLVIYVAVPTDAQSSETARAAASAFAPALQILREGNLKIDVAFQCIDHADIAQSAGPADAYSGRLKRLCFAVFQKLGRVIPPPSSRNVSRYEPPKVFTPLFTLAPESLVQPLEAQPGSITIEKRLMDSVLHCTYGLSPDGGWVVAVWTDGVGELLETCTFALTGQTPLGVDSRGNALGRLWAHTLDIVRSTKLFWHIVIAKDGAMSDMEASCWADCIEPEEGLVLTLTVVSVFENHNFQVFQDGAVQVEKHFFPRSRTIAVTTVPLPRCPCCTLASVLGEVWISVTRPHQPPRHPFPLQYRAEAPEASTLRVQLISRRVFANRAAAIPHPLASACQMTILRALAEQFDHLSWLLLDPVISRGRLANALPLHLFLLRRLAPLIPTTA
eukprot:m.61159 g.61159  ORF g.61159 m.61159 type:complete len:1220 (+) comp7326_c0_seq1:74-3733(+)